MLIDCIGFIWPASGWWKLVKAPCLLVKAPFSSTHQNSHNIQQPCLAARNASTPRCSHFGTDLPSWKPLWVGFPNFAMELMTLGGISCLDGAWIMRISHNKVWVSHKKPWISHNKPVYIWLTYLDGAFFLKQPAICLHTGKHPLLIMTKVGRVERNG